VSVDSLQRAIADGDRVLLDTSVLAAYFDRAEASHPVAQYVVDELVGSGRNTAIVSMVTVMEILIRPMRATPQAHHTVLGFLRSQPYLDLVPVNEQVAQDAANLRAMRRFSAPDALVVGTGLATQVHHLVTNDLAWQAKLKDMASRITVVRLADHLPFPPRT
jgi:predicted nucleic acid-binding protein